MNNVENVELDPRGDLLSQIEKEMKAKRRKSNFLNFLSAVILSMIGIFALLAGTPELFSDTSKEIVTKIFSVLSASLAIIFGKAKFKSRADANQTTAYKLKQLLIRSRNQEKPLQEICEDYAGISETEQQIISKPE